MTKGHTVIANDDSLRATQDGGDTPEALKHDIDRLAEINAELLADLSEALRLLEFFCVACNIRTGISPDDEVYELVQKERHGALAKAWLDARQFLAKVK